MSHWGYPVGWISDTDPRDVVRRRILGDFRTLEHDNALEDADDSFLIIIDEGDSEVIDLSLATSFHPKSDRGETPVTDDTLSTNSDFESRSSTPRRWAIYPETYFSSHHLTVYNGMTLGSSTVATSYSGNTFTAERRALWEQIVSGTHTAKVLVPPWRLPGAFSSLQSHNENQPPPPPPRSSPPPLPPSPPPFPTPSPPPARPKYFSLATVAEDDSDNSDMDMDLSDDESLVLHKS
ncbi:hypothetical protein DEU56DRAFT_165866 [Suillus clintonianus]|uniref:uncharacterized protein n=1 Tax=Suillus clintonianus TaxID=1904413 RepID=UPI001B8699D1|nr:uncharacterized protein DEU56DRAFT_165866 [Suillus clintonianus]KAG2116384.1 hypothetical protein DEU56DRAFT_165866 [Suillus clintonianus]